MNLRSLLSLVAVLVTLAFIPAAHGADVDGFKGMRWGSYLTDLQQTKKLVLTKDGGKKSATLYALEGEDLRYGKATLSGIHCSFIKERLEGVILLFSGAKNFAAVKAEAFAKFGQTQKIDQNKEELYNWSGTITNTILSYNQNSQSGFLFLKVKKMPPPTKMAAQPKPAASPAPETALDRAAPATKPAPAKPAASSADMETALDREPLPTQPAQSSQPIQSASDITPEMQALINRDQALTQLCWETNGPAADAACVQMRENIDRLNAMGLCVKPDASGQSGTEVVWYRCGPATVPAAQQPATATTQAQPGDPGTLSAMPPTAAPATAIPTFDEAKNQRCRLIGELFATAAQMRDNGADPQMVEEELLWRANSQIPEITIERIRETVELIYFDREYSQNSGESLIHQVSSRCLSGNGPYAHPLP